jgi:hypothetical protein
MPEECNRPASFGFNTGLFPKISLTLDLAHFERLVLNARRKGWNRVRLVLDQKAQALHLLPERLLSVGEEE